MKRTTLAAAAALALGITPALATTAHADSPLTCATDTTQTAGHYTCQVSGTTSQTSVTLPFTASDGVQLPAVGTVIPMASGAGTMTFVAGGLRFDFSAAYTASHTAPYSYSGGLTFSVDAWGHKGPFTVTVNGQTWTTDGPGGYCDETCRAQPHTGIDKSAWDGGSGVVQSQLNLGADKVVPGQTVTLADTVGPGQSDCTASLYSVLAGKYSHIADSTSLAFTYTIPADTPAGTWITETVACHVDGSQKTYSDQGTVAGQPVSAQTTVAGVWADGKGTTKPKPPVVNTYTRTVQVDREQVSGSAWFASKIAAATNDGVLKQGELRNVVYGTTAAKKHVKEASRFVTVTIKQATAPTDAQWLAATSKATGLTLSPAKVAAITTPNSDVTYVWQLAPGSTVARPFAGGPQVYVGATPAGTYSTTQQPTTGGSRRIG